MSDDEEYYDDDDYIYFDDGPYADADDLAEHTMPSPVWLDNDPVLDLDDILEELLLDGDDEYFDQKSSTKRKRGVDNCGEQTLNGNDVANKRRKLLTATQAPGKLGPGNNLEDPLVVWRGRRHEPMSYPTIRDGVGKSIALLKNWRGGLKEPVVDSTAQIKRRTSQTAFAVVIERRQPKDTTTRYITPTTDAEPGHAPKPQQMEVKPDGNGHTVSTSSGVKGSKQRKPVAATVDRPALAQKSNSATVGTSKRKAPDDDEDELQGDDVELPRVKKKIKKERPAASCSPPLASTNQRKKRKEAERSGNRNTILDRTL